MAMERAVKLLEAYADATIQTGTVVYDNTNREPKKVDIKVEDGKVVQQDDVKEHISYKYEDDRNLYLKEYQYKKIEDENIDDMVFDNIPKDENNLVYKAVEMLYNSIGQEPSELKINIQTILL